MENLMLLLAGSLAFTFSKKKRKAKMKTIGDTDCIVPLFSNSELLHQWQTSDGDTVHYGEVTEGDTTFGFVMVHYLKKSREETAIVLADLLHELFSALRMKYRTGATSENNMDGPLFINCLSDYWQNSSGIDYKVKAFSNGRTFGFLYIKNISVLQAQEMDAFLNSFRFQH
jgi:hypothetical protein